MTLLKFLVQNNLAPLWFMKTWTFSKEILKNIEIKAYR